MMVRTDGIDSCAALAPNLWHQFPDGSGTTSRTKPAL